MADTHCTSPQHRPVAKLYFQPLYPTGKVVHSLCLWLAKKEQYFRTKDPNGISSSNACQLQFQFILYQFIQLYNERESEK